MKHDLFYFELEVRKNMHIKLKKNVFGSDSIVHNFLAKNIVLNYTITFFRSLVKLYNYSLGNLIIKKALFIKNIAF